jgi:hypothetical protein
MVKRHELTNEQIERIQDILPQNSGRGRKWQEHSSSCVR